jgi:hypothetical protein
MQPEERKKWILSEIDKIDCKLSPENLFCDGEIDHSEGVRRGKVLLAERSKLERMLGEKVQYKG